MGEATPRTVRALGAQIKARREALGWSLARLAEEAALKAPSYVLRIERGEKIPSADVAQRLLLALDDAEAGKSRSLVQRNLRLSFEDLLGSTRWRTILAGLPMPLLEPGEDPNEAEHAKQQLELAVQSDAALQAKLAEMVAPFAYRINPELGRRAPKLLPEGFYALLTTRVEHPLKSHEIYAVRVGGRIELGFVHWDGDRLALLPHTDPKDLVLLPAPSQDQLARILAGEVAIVAQPQTVEILPEPAGDLLQHSARPQRK
jgi:transcriptional regulator with XRE-family HTH domain